MLIILFFILNIVLNTSNRDKCSHESTKEKQNNFICSDKVNSKNVNEKLKNIFFVDNKYYYSKKDKTKIYHFLADNKVIMSNMYLRSQGFHSYDSIRKKYSIDTNIISVIDPDFYSQDSTDFEFLSGDFYTKNLTVYISFKKKKFVRIYDLGEGQGFKFIDSTDIRDFDTLHCDINSNKIILKSKKLSYIQMPFRDDAAIYSFFIK